MPLPYCLPKASAGGIATTAVASAETAAGQLSKTNGWLAKLQLYSGDMSNAFTQATEYSQ